MMSDVSKRIELKLEQLRKLIAEHDCAFLQLEGQENFSWLLEGRGHIGLASTAACATILVGAEGLYLVANNIEMNRLLDEQVAAYPSLKSVVFPWHDPAAKQEVIAAITGGKPVLNEPQVGAELRGLRTHLNTHEIAELRAISQETAKIVEASCKQLRAGISEIALAGALSQQFWEQDLDPITLLIAFDERAKYYKHPLPVNNKLKEFALVVVCTRRNGLICSVTRMVSLRPNEELERNIAKTGYLEMVALSETYPGNTVSNVFSSIVAGYQRVGEEEHWMAHHQGGLTGFVAREIRADFTTDHRIRANEAYAWNPSLHGAKSENTILVTESGYENLTYTGEYVYITDEIDGLRFRSEGVLVLN